MANTGRLDAFSGRNANIQTIRFFKCVRIERIVRVLPLCVKVNGLEGLLGVGQILILDADGACLGVPCGPDAIPVPILQ